MGLSRGVEERKERGPRNQFLTQGAMKYKNWLQETEEERKPKGCAKWKEKGRGGSRNGLICLFLIFIPHFSDDRLPKQLTSIDTHYPTPQ